MTIPNDKNLGESLADKKLRLEIESLEIKNDLEKRKLELEAKGLESKHKWEDRVARYIPVMTALVAVAGVLIGAQQFKKQQEFDRHALAAQSLRDYETRQQELKKEYWEEQIEIYKEAGNAAAAIATAKTLEEVEEERKKFWRLYWGIMSLIEHSEVEKAMKAFGDQLLVWENSKTKPASLETLSYRIAHCSRKSLQKTWSPVDIGDYGNTRCPY